MANVIITKNSSTVSDVPTAGQLVEGELAVNTNDEKLYSKNASAVFEIAPFQTSIVGITGTMAQFDTAVTNGNIAYAGGGYHDGFSDFVTEEHIRWDLTGAGTIHTDNYIENATHTGQVTGSGALTMVVAAITGQTDIGANLIGTDEIIVSDAGVIRRADISRFNNYFDANLNFNNYTHPSHPGDDFSVDSGALSGATIISDIDINVTTDAEGHVTDANGFINTRELTAGDIGAATSGHLHDGIADTNLLDKTANESISGFWGFTSGDVNLADNVQLQVGGGADGAFHYHSSSDEVRITVVGTADYRLLLNASETAIFAARDGAVTLYHNNAAKIATASDGVDITGDMGSTTMQGLGYHASSGDGPPGADVWLRSNTSGYLYTGWINTVSGSTTTDPVRIYCSQDSFLRYMTPAVFIDFIEGEDWNFSTVVDFNVGLIVGGSILPAVTDVTDLGSSNLFFDDIFVEKIQLNHASDTSLTRAAAGVVQVEGQAMASHETTGFNSAKINFSTSAPSGGIDGDMWFRY